MRSQRSRALLLVVLTGAYGNVGDAVIRRIALDWARESGEVHAYVGNAPDQWIEELQLRESDETYRASDRRRWLKQLLRRDRRPHLVLDPGEVPVSRSALKHELMFLLITLVVRLRGGVVLRPPRGIGAPVSRATIAVHRLACRLSTSTSWRNERSLSVVRVGSFTPDIAFAYPEPNHSGTVRSHLLVSMRGRLQSPSEAWVGTVRQIAAAHQLQIVVAAQVREDEGRASELATRLGAAHLSWGNATDLEREAELFDLYRSVRLAVSDRLHVLIFSALHGAVPVEVSDAPRSKITETLNPLGLTDCSFNSSTQQIDEIVRGVSALLDREPHFYRSALRRARSQLDQLRGSWQRSLASHSGASRR